MKAFPTAADNGHSENQDGMDLRDYFAAKAMQFQEWHYYTVDGGTVMDLRPAKRCYDMADAMMEARKK